MVRKINRTAERDLVNLNSNRYVSARPDFSTAFLLNEGMLENRKRTSL